MFQEAYGQGWSGKTQPSLTHPVLTDLNHTEKPTKVGKTEFYQHFSNIFELKLKFSKKLSELTSKRLCKLESNW